MNYTYGTDLASLNKSGRSILKNNDQKNSLAYTNSILRKDPTKMHTEGIGINPNLPVEDEYIQNLIKQIHFMDLEIKLLKEKQQQDEALGGNFNFTKIGLRDGKAPTEHIMTTTNKFKQMKLDTAKNRNALEVQLLKKREENTILKAKVDNMQKNVEEMGSKFNQITLESSNAENEHFSKLSAERKAREDVERDINRIQKTLEKIIADNERLNHTVDMKEIENKHEKAKYDAEEAMLKADEKEKDDLIAQLTKEKEDLTELIAKDPKLSILIEENKLWMEKCRTAERRLNEAQYLFAEKEVLQALSIKQKEHEIEQRKKLQDIYDKEVEALEDTIKQTENKVQHKLRVTESTEIKGLNQKLEKELREIYQLNEKIKELEKKYIEFAKANFIINLNCTNLEKKKNDLQAQLDSLNKENAELEPKYTELIAINENLHNNINEATETRKKLLAKVKEVEEEFLTVSNSYSFLKANIKLGEDMKKFDIQELREVQQANMIVNEGIKNFMDKWEYLRKISERIA